MAWVLIFLPKNGEIKNKKLRIMEDFLKENLINIKIKAFRKKSITETKGA
ncbi:hypothetical protein SH2C18_48220 [Clostridium sediminicola]